MSDLWLATYTTPNGMTYYSVSYTYIGNPPCTSLVINYYNTKDYIEHKLYSCSVIITTLKDITYFINQESVPTRHSIQTLNLINDTAQFVTHTAGREDAVTVNITTVNCYGCNINVRNLHWESQSNIYIYK